MKLQTVGICMKPDQPQAAGLVRGLEKWLEERGLRLVLDEDAAVHTGGSGVSPRQLKAPVELSQASAPSVTAINNVSAPLCSSQ